MEQRGHRSTGSACRVLLLVLTTSCASCELLGYFDTPPLQDQPCAPGAVEDRACGPCGEGLARWTCGDDRRWSGPGPCLGNPYDVDGDGYGSAGCEDEGRTCCGEVDCDDSDPEVWPGHADRDGDGHDDDACGGDDCIDWDPARWSGHADLDGDGHEHALCGGDDCDDDCDDCYAGAAPRCGLARDHDCDGVVDELSGCGSCSVGEPHYVANLRLDYHINTMFVVAEHVFVAGERGLFAIVDASDPTTPRVVGGPVETGCELVHDIFVSGDHAFLGCGRTPTRGGFMVYEVADVRSPLLVGGVEEAVANDLFVSGGVLFFPNLRDALDQQDATLDLYDVSAPDSPELLSRLELATMTADGQRLWDIFVAGRHAYVVGDAGVAVFDVSDPRAPRLVGGPVSPGFDVAQVFVSAGHAYAVSHPSDEQVAVLDVRDPSSPTVVSALSHFEVDGVFVAGHQAFVVGTGFMQVFDVSEPSEPMLVTEAVGIQAHLLFVQGGTAFINGLEVVDLDCRD